VEISSSGGFLCFGFFRSVFGTIGREAFTGPTRSRAIARTSFFWSNLSFRFAIPAYATLDAEGGRMLKSIGLPELLVILVVALLLFGGKKIPEVAKGLGEGIRNFKSSLKGEEDHPDDKKPA
jgi:sec-independent protein translocase protein TatA